MVQRTFSCGRCFFLTNGLVGFSDGPYASIDFMNSISHRAERGHFHIMRTVASQITYLYRRKPGNVRFRNFSSSNAKDELSIEEDAERKVGWLLKLFFAGTAAAVGYQFFPYMGDNLLHQSVSLLHVKDPLFKRMGASRLARFAIDDERRMKVVELGGAKQLIEMLGAARDDHTRKEALKALAALSHSDKAVGALHHAGAISVVMSTPDSTEYAEIGKYKVNLLKRFEDLRYDVPLEK